MNHLPRQDTHTAGEVPDGDSGASRYTPNHFIPTGTSDVLRLSYHSRQLFLALCLLLILVLGVAACGDDGQDEPFRIGVMESLTGAGETYGTVANQSKQMAADEINAAGGIYGRMLEFIIEDSKCNAADAIAAYHKLTDTAFATVCTTSRGAALSATTTASTPTARSWGSLGWSWRCYRQPSAPRTGSTGCSAPPRGGRTRRVHLCTRRRAARFPPSRE